MLAASTSSVHRTPPAARRPGRSLALDSLGSTTFEHVVILSLVALVALGAFAWLGGVVEEDVRCTSRAILAGRGGDCAGVAGAPIASVREVARASASDGAGRSRGALSDPLETLGTRFDEIARGDDRITTGDLERARASDDSAIRAAATALLGSPTTLHAIDVGAGDGEVDGEISEADVAGFAQTVARGELVDALADTASGAGGRDHEVSRDDLLAMAADASLPEDLHAWARERMASMPEPDEGSDEGCDWWNAVCHVSHGAEWVWDHTDGARDAAVRAGGFVLGLVQRSTWLAGFPLLLPDQVDDFATFRANVGLGILDWVKGTAEGLYKLGEWAIDRQVSSWQALFHGDYGSWLATQTGLDLIEQAPKAWDIAKGLVEHTWHQIDTFASGPPDEAGRAGGALAMDVASVVVPVAWSTRPGSAAGVLDDAARYADDVAREGAVAPALVRAGTFPTTAEAAETAVTAIRARLTRRFGLEESDIRVLYGEEYHSIFIRVDNEQMTIHADITTFGAEDTRLFIDMWATRGEARGTGLSRQMLDEVEQVARDYGAQRSVIVGSLRKAWNYWTHMGYAETGSRPFTHDKILAR